jgi:fatty acid desaturase
LDIINIDVRGFAAEIDQIKSEAYQNLNNQDYQHLKKIELLGGVASLLGYMTAWIIPNPVTAFLLSLGQFTRWLLAHHILHKGYDKVPGVPPRYTSAHFAAGWRRYIDWFDWLHPKAWDYEHNVLHHYNTGEDADPDLAERHVTFLRKMPVPRFIKYIILAVVSITWKYTYYAPNTMSVLDPESQKRIKSEHIAYLTIKNLFQFNRKSVRALWMQSYLPYAGIHFVVIPLLFFPLGQMAVLSVFINKLLAECIFNFHSFLVIGPNHTADDLCRFTFHYRNKEEFYVTQVLGSANYNCGGDFVDYMSIWLNYQIEHHLIPDLPMTKYREIQPRVKALCEKYQIPYRQESIFKRFRRMVDVCVGKTSLQELRVFPTVARAAGPLPEF